jgi:hypothetical protein
MLGLEQQAVFTATELLGHDNSGVQTLLGRQDVITAAAQIDGQSGNDVAVESQGTKSASRPAESAMGLLFLGDQREDFIAMVEEVAQGVEDLSLGDAQRLGDLQDGFATPVQRGHVADRHPQAIDHGLAAADAREPNNVRMLGLDSFRHAEFSKERELNLSPV